MMFELHLYCAKLYVYFMKNPSPTVEDESLLNIKVPMLHLTWLFFSTATDIRGQSCKDSPTGTSRSQPKPCFLPRGLGVALSVTLRAIESALNPARVTPQPGESFYIFATHGLGQQEQVRLRK